MECLLADLPRVNIKSIPNNDDCTCNTQHLVSVGLGVDMEYLYTNFGEKKVKLTKM